MEKHDKKEVIEISKVDIDHFKSIYYWMNGKSDTNIKLYKKIKIVKLEDIISLNTSIQKKLSLHETVTTLCHVNISMEKGRTLSFANWDSFIKTDFVEAEKTESATITWDINFKMVEYPIPQRHILKVRIGSTIKPSEFFQLIATSDDDAEINQATSFLICKVDFINGIIANELMNIVDQWYNALEPSLKNDSMIKFFDKYNYEFARFAHYIVHGALFSILYFIFKLHLTNRETVVFSKVTYLDLYFWLILIVITFSISEFIGKILATRMLRTIEKFDISNYFRITKGDINAIILLRKKNTSIFKDIYIQLIVSILITILSLFSTNIYSWIMKL